ncbi:MAG: hypothetical protein A3I07_03355 [Candidatus Doudnabacteria bacterium RIFCSPLOWO2_02_FULL_42_9]|nr:MAG: hypothetical protein A3I07_03355 [Candidatus Doudnabacteria bacterium RIFCSPLOWO2_02_FULL_42_9]
MLIDVKGVRILTDPGLFSKGYESLINIDIVLITHEHPDHFHLDALKVILKNNPRAKVITNSSVAKLTEDIKVSVVGNGQSIAEQGILIEGIGTKHGAVYGNFPETENTGYFINNQLFYPGDNFTNPNKPVEILAVPTSGPWLKLSEAIDYARQIKPRVCFPVHDGVWLFPAFMNNAMDKFLEGTGIKYRVLQLGQETEI